MSLRVMTFADCLQGNFIKYTIRSIWRRMPRRLGLDGPKGLRIRIESHSLGLTHLLDSVQVNGSLDRIYIDDTSYCYDRDRV